MRIFMGCAACAASAFFSTSALAAMDFSLPSLDSIWEKRAEKCSDILDMGKQKQAVPENFEVAWRVARLVNYGGFFCFPENTDASVKMDYFKYGADAATKARKIQPNRVEGHYWFASVYGGYALSKGVRASLSGAPEMRDACTEAIKIDPKYHFAGPYRIRGRLYFALPPFISFGDNKQAYEDLKKAMEMGSESKLNSVYFSEVQAKVENKDAAIRTLEKAKQIPDVVGVKEDAAYRNDIERLLKKLK